MITLSVLFAGLDEGDRYGIDGCEFCIARAGGCGCSSGNCHDNFGWGG